jgi:hypothetical protein
MVIDGFARAIASAASIAQGGLWTIESGEGERFIAHRDRRVAVVRDHGPMRVVMLMALRNGRPVLAGQKGPLDPRTLGARLAAFVRECPDVETILDVAPRMLARLRADDAAWTLRWEGHWDGDRTLACIERPRMRAWVLCTQEAHGVDSTRHG